MHPRANQVRPLPQLLRYITDKAGIVDVGKAELLKYDLCREITRTVPGVPFVILSANARVGSNPHWAKNGPKKTVSA